MKTDKQESGKKEIIIIAAVVVVAAIVALCLVFGLRVRSSSRQLAKQLDIGQRYLTEMDYEAAVVAFQAAIEIEPKSVESYLGIVEAYEGLGDYETALSWAQTGYDETGSEEMQAKVEKLTDIIAELSSGGNFSDETFGASNDVDETTYTDDETQENVRVLNWDWLTRLSLGADDVLSVTVLDSTADAPSDALDASKTMDGSVLAWKTADNGLYDVYIAGDGGVMASEFSDFMFEGLTNVVSMNLEGLDTSNVLSMFDMFRECSSLTSLDLSGFDTSKVTNMNAMFYECEALTSVNMSGWDTSNVIDMSWMFWHCGSLENLDVSEFDTSQVTDMLNMFNDCKSLEYLDVSGFDTSQVTSMSSMFSGCSSLTDLDVSGFDTSQVTNMSGMFGGCSSLTNLDVSGFNTSQVTYMNSMFSDCSSLTSIDVSNFDTSSVREMRRMFYKCISLTYLDLSGFDTSQLEFEGDDLMLEGTIYKGKKIGWWKE